MYTYKNLTDYELTVPNFGLVPPGGTIQTEIELNSPNLQPLINQTSVVPPPARQSVQAIPEPPQEGEN
jgi:hypothetical protein